MKKIKIFIAAFIFLAMGAFVFVPTSPVGAAALDKVCVGNDDSEVCKNKDKTADGVVKAVINTLLYIVGALSVVMIIIGGFQYILSQGDSGSVSKAKNTILYSVIGFIVSLLAYAIVNWVLHGIFHII